MNTMTGQERSIESRAQEHRYYREQCRRGIRTSLILSTLLTLAIGLWTIFSSLNLWIAGAILAASVLSLCDEIAGCRYHTRQLRELGYDDDDSAEA